MIISYEVQKMERERFYLNGWKAGVLGETYGPGSDDDFVRGYRDAQEVRAKVVGADLLSHHLLGLRSALADEPAPDCTTEAIDAGRREGERVRTEVLASADKSEFDREKDYRRALMRALGLADSLALLTWEEVLREVGRVAGMASPDTPPAGYYVVQTQGDSLLDVKIANGNVWGFSRLDGVPGYRTIGRAWGAWIAEHPGAKWWPGVDRMKEGEGVRIGGDPPALEVGMVYTDGNVTSVVTATPWPTGASVTEVRAPWGGPVVWRRA